jgi:para-nitrobenzyl esterase
MNWKLKAAALAAGAMLLDLSSAAAGPFEKVPDAGGGVDASSKWHHAQSVPPPVCPGPSVNVAGAAVTGCWSGRTGSGVAVYQGIPYGSATRWQNANVVTPAGSINATKAGNICPQAGASTHPDWPAMQEDCLNLNIWAPSGAAPSSLPVMVFIHGGAFISGHGSSPLFDGSALAQQGVIVVTLNYRLGALGFLVNSGLGANGNFGLVDQQIALHWVSNYIGAFGGDPTKVTIFGESAGAMSVGLHVFSVPSSTYLFRAAMMESNPMGILYNTLAQGQNSGEVFLIDLCLKYNPGHTCDAAWYRGLSVQDILTEQARFVPTSGINPRAITWAPVIDNSVVWGQPTAGYAKDTNTGQQSLAKPMVFGINRDEGVLFATAVGGSSTAPSQSLYQGYLSHDFGAYGPVTNIPRYDISTGTYCYFKRFQHAPPNPFCYYSPWGQSMANVMTDYSFATGNIVAAMNSQGSFIPPVFAYAFTQKPVFDPYPIGVDHGACWPSQHHVCHGNELPYVFNTLAYYLGDSIQPGDQQLANSMTKAWAEFAKSPLAPGSDWTQFSGSIATNATVFGNDAVTTGQPFFPNFNETFWQPCYTNPTCMSSGKPSPTAP